MVVKVIIKDTTITLNEILIWIKKGFFWNLFQSWLKSWFIMRYRFSKISEKFKKKSDNRPEPPGSSRSDTRSKNYAFWKWCSVKWCSMISDPKCKCIQIHSGEFKISGEIKENYFSRSCFILWKFRKKQTKKSFHLLLPYP